MATSVRVDEKTRARAAQLAAVSGSTIGEVVDRALEAYETALFWEETRQALQAAGGHVEDEDDWLWERTLRDGLERG